MIKRSHFPFLGNQLIIKRMDKQHENKGAGDILVLAILFGLGFIIWSLLDEKKSETDEFKQKLKKANDLVASIEQRHQESIIDKSSSQEQQQTAEIQELKSLIEQFNIELGEDFLHITSKKETIAIPASSIIENKSNKSVIKEGEQSEEKNAFIDNDRRQRLKELAKPDFSSLPKFNFPPPDFLNTPPPPKKKKKTEPITIGGLMKFLDEWNDNEYGKIVWYHGVEVLEDIFMQLTRQVGLIEPILTEAEVKEFLRNNFTCYPDKPTGRVFSANVKHKYTLEGFIYQVYKEYKLNRNQKDDYARLLTRKVVLF